MALPDWEAIRTKVGAPGGLHRRLELDPETLRAMRGKGYSVLQIAKWFNVSTSTVNRNLFRHR
jgi:hypothetical protein